MNNVNVLLDKIATLRGIHEDSATMAHAILRNKDEDWQPYIPTHFVYAFLTFNTLYNFDWGQCLEQEELREFKDITESRKITQYAKFCCIDKNFCRIYKTFFLRYVTQCYCKEKILEEFKKITPDSSIDDRLLQEFLQACHECLEKQKLTRYIVNNIAFFIYKIRCNLFHGKKTLEDLKNEEQQTRLEIYSMFLIAINQMIFSYLEYKKGVDIKNSFDSLLSTLKWNKIEISQNDNMYDLRMEGDI